MGRPSTTPWPLLRVLAVGYYCLCAALFGAARGALMRADQARILLGLKAQWSKFVALPDWDGTRDCAQWGYRVRCDSDGALTFLDISSASLQVPLPAAIGRLTTLTFLNASNNRLYYNVPAFLGAMPRLHTLLLYSNWFIQPMPAWFFRTSTNLRIFDVANNWIPGRLPPSIARLRHLERLKIANNWFSGPFPVGICACTSLEELRISNNWMRGTIPPCIGRLRSMRLMYIDTNGFWGRLPESISGMASLANLFMNQNKFQLPLPASLAAMTWLQVLFMSSNPYLKGPLPANIGAMRSLKHLVCEFCHLTGTIPQSISLLTNMERLLLDGNYMTGRVPAGLSALVKLTQLYLQFNFFSGTFPAELSRLPYLQRLSIYHNQFTGPPPTGFVSPYLQQLSTYANYFAGRALFTYNGGRQAFCYKSVDAGRNFFLISSYDSNCLTFGRGTCPYGQQRTTQECQAFCNAHTGKACGGHGYCTTRVNGYPLCVCDRGYVRSASGLSCVRAGRRRSHARYSEAALQLLH